jgi:hypothetical protein
VEKRRERESKKGKKLVRRRVKEGGKLSKSE